MSGRRWWWVLAALGEAPRLLTPHSTHSNSLSTPKTHCSAGQFYIKFNMRQYLGDILAYAWRLQPHRDAWKVGRALLLGEGLGRRGCRGACPRTRLALEPQNRVSLLAAAKQPC